MFEDAIIPNGKAQGTPQETPTGLSKFTDAEIPGGSRRSLPGAWQLPTKDPDLATGYIAQGDLEDYMASKQSLLSLVGKAATQTVSEGLFGTVEAASYLGDWEQMWDHLHGDEQNYTNWLAESMKKLKSGVEDSTHIYQTARDREGFNPSSATWWAANSPQTLGSTLSLMIPAMGIAGVAAKTAKILGAGELGVELASGLSATAASRYAESTMEANNVYQQALAQGASPEKAGEAAAKTWNTNWIFALQDLGQYMTLMKGLKSLSKGAKGMSIGEAVMQMPSEALEEAGQFIVSEEARRSAMDSNVDYFGAGFNNRLYSYLQDPEFKASALLGAVGGGVFAGLSKVADATAGKGQDLGAAIGKGAGWVKEQFGNIINRGLQKERANAVNDTATSKFVDDIGSAQSILDAVHNGTLNSLKRDYEEIEKDKNTDPDAKHDIKKRIEDIDFIATETSRLKATNTPESLRNQILMSKLSARQLSRIEDKLTSEIQTLESETIKNKELPEEAIHLKKLQVEMQALQDLATRNPIFAPLAAKATEAFNTAIAEPMVDVAFPNLAQTLTTTNDGALRDKTAQLISTKGKISDLKKDLHELTTPEGQAAALKREAIRKADAAAKSVMSKSDVTEAQLQEVLKSGVSPEIAAETINKIAGLADQVRDQKKAETENEITANLDATAPAPEVPSEVLPDEGPTDVLPFDEEPLPETAPANPIPAPDTEQLKNWFAPQDIESVSKKLQGEGKTNRPQPVEESKKEDFKRIQTIKTAKTIITRLKQVAGEWVGTGANRKFEPTLDELGIPVPATYYHTNGNAVTAEDIFETDPNTGRLIFDSPLVKAGDKVLLIVENPDVFPYTLTRGFKPTNRDESVINVYRLKEDGSKMDKPMTQLPTGTEKGKGGNNLSLLVDLRNKVIQEGQVITTIVSKNVGDVRRSSVPHTLEILKHDYVENNGKFSWKQTPYRPILAIAGEENKLYFGEAYSMSGVDQSIQNKIAKVEEMERSNTLPEGARFVLRTNPVGNLQLVQLEGRLLNVAEKDWLKNNMSDFLENGDLGTLAEVLHVKERGLELFKLGKGGRPITRESGRQLIHIETTKGAKHVLIPTTNNLKDNTWVSVSPKDLKNIITNQPFIFRRVDNYGRWDTTQQASTKVDATEVGKIVQGFNRVLDESYRNMRKETINSELPYQDFVSGKEYPTYYDFLVDTETATIEQPGSPTGGKGRDSSYSFFNGGLHLSTVSDPYTITSTGTNDIVIKDNTVPKPEESKTAPSEEYEDEELLRTRIPAPGYATISEKELEWFKSHLGEDALSIAKDVDRVISKGGKEAFGIYHNALVRLAQFSEEGTAYHEGLHFIMDPQLGLVTEKERETLLNEAAKIYGIDRSYDKLETTKESLRSVTYSEELDKINDEIDFKQQELAEEADLEYDKKVKLKTVSNPINYVDYFKKKYASTGRYTGPRNKDELAKDIKNIVHSLRYYYLNKEQTDTNVKLGIIPKGVGEVVPITIRFLENIRKNSNQSTSLASPFRFKDATTKENEILNEFYNEIKKEVEHFAKTNNKAVPKVIPNERLVEKLSAWLDNRYGIITLETPSSSHPYGLGNIIEGGNDTSIAGSEVFISDGLHFPSISTGHAKLFKGSNIYSNTLGWFIENNIAAKNKPADRFLYEFQSDILPEINEETFAFTKVLQDTLNPDLVKFYLGGHEGSLVVNRKTATDDLVDLKKNIKELIYNNVKDSARYQAASKIAAEKRMRRDTELSKKEDNEAEIAAKQVIIDNPASTEITAYYLDHLNKLKFFTKLAQEDIRSAPDPLGMLAEKMGARGFRAIYDNLTPLSPESLHRMLEVNPASILHYNNQSFATEDVFSTLHSIATSLARKAHKRDMPASPFIGKSKSLTSYFNVLNARKSAAGKAIWGIKRRQLAISGKSELLAQDPTYIDNYYENRERDITNFFTRVYFDAIEPIIEEKVDSMMDAVLTALAMTNNKTEVAEDIQDYLAKRPISLIQKDYENWYNIMFDKFIRISLLRAKAQGFRDVYLPTYKSMKKIEGSNKTGLIYATPQEDLHDKLVQDAIEKATSGKLKVGDYIYSTIVSNGTAAEPIFLKQEIIKRLAPGEGVVKSDKISITKEEFNQAIQAYAKKKRVGPFYTALSKIKGINIIGLEQPEWSSVPLLKVSLDNYNPTSIERFREMNNELSEAYNNLTNDQLLEEKLAEDFRIYMMSGGKILPKKEAKGIRAFFKRLYEAIKRFLGFGTPIEEMFKKFSSQELTPAQRALIKRVQESTLSMTEPNHRLLPGFKTYKRQVEAVNAATYKAMQMVWQYVNSEDNKNGRTIEELLTAPADGTGESFLDVVLNVVRNSFKNSYQELHNKETRTPKEQEAHDSYLATGAIEDVDPVDIAKKGNWEDTSTELQVDTGFKTEVIKAFSQFGFRIKLQDGTIYEPNTENSEPVTQEGLTQSDLDMTEENVKEDIHGIDITMKDPMKSLSQKLKLFLASIPDPQSTTVHGLALPIDQNKVFSALSYKLANSKIPLVELEKIHKNDPILEAVYNRIIEEVQRGNQNIVNEVNSRFTLSRTNFVTVKKEYTTDGSILKTMDTNRNSVHRTVVSQWQNELVKKGFVNREGAPILNKVRAQYENLQDFIEKYREAKIKKQALPYNVVKDELVKQLGALGITLPEKIFTALDEEATALANTAIRNNTITRWLLGEYNDSLEKFLSRMSQGVLPDAESTILTVLAKEYVKYVKVESSDSFLDDNYNQRYPLNLPSPLDDVINAIKTNPQEVADYFKQDKFYSLDPSNPNRTNQFVALMTNPTTRALLAVENPIGFVDGLQDSKDHENRTPADSMMIRFAKFFNNSEKNTSGGFFLGTHSDKTKQSSIVLPKKNTVVDAHKFLYNILQNTADAEAVRIQRLSQDFVRDGKNPLPSDIEHYNKRGKQFLYIPELNTIPELSKSLTNGDIGAKEYKEAAEKRNQVIKDFIDKQYSLFVDEMAALGIVERSGSTIVNATIPDNVLAGGSVENFLKLFFYNDFGWRHELSKVFNGDIAFYKTDDDYFKRGYQTVTPGIKPYNNPEDPTNFTVGIYPKQEKINTAETLLELAKLVDTNITLDDIKKGKNSTNPLVKKLADFAHVEDGSDSQTLMTVDAWRRLLQPLGDQFWSKGHQILYDFAWKDNKTLNQALREKGTSPEQAVYLRKLALEVATAPAKPFQFNDRVITLPSGDKMIIKEQFKDSRAALNPEFALRHPGYRDMLQYMSDNKIDVMISPSAVKVGLYGVLDLSQPAEQWQKRIVSLSDIRIPQLNNNNIKEDVSGSQFHKLITGNVRHEGNYEVPYEGKLTGKQVLEKYGESWAEIHERDSAKLKRKLGFNGDKFQLSTKPNVRQKQLFKIKLMLEQELMARNLNENYADAIRIVLNEMEQPEFQTSLAFPSYSYKFTSVFTNLFKKVFLNPKSPGFVGVDMADFVNGSATDRNLRFLRNENGEITEAEIAMPINFFGKIGLTFKKHVDRQTNRIKWEELNENQKRALQGILYRIPTSNKSSITPVRIAMVTHPSQGQVVVVPPEMLTQQGLDFDYDKSQILLRVLNKDGSVDKTAPENKIFNLAWGILTSKEHFEELVTALTSKGLKKISEGFKAKDQKEWISPMNAAKDVMAENQNRDAKAMIGIFSRGNTAHSVLQVLNQGKYIFTDPAFDLPFSDEEYHFGLLGGMYDNQGKLISENFGEYQSAALDSAKDPFLYYLSTNRVTAPIVVRLLLSGASQELVNNFINQPIIKEWVKALQLNGGKNTAAAYLDVADKYNLTDLYDGYKLDLAPIHAATLKATINNMVGQNSAHDANVLAALNILEHQSRFVAKLTNILSIDTFGDMTGPESLDAMRRNLYDLTYGDGAVQILPEVFGFDEEGKIDISRAPKETRRLASFFKHAIFDALDFVGQFFPYQQGAYTSAISALGNKLGLPVVLNKALIKRMNQFLDVYTLETNGVITAALDRLAPNPRNRWLYTDPGKSIMSYVDDMTKQFPKLTTARIIKAIAPSYSVQGGVQMIGIEGASSKINKTDLTKSWRDLMLNKEPAIRTLAYDLVRFAIATSGFQFGTRTFVDLIPNEFWVENGITKEHYKIVENMKLGLGLDVNAASVSFIRHNFRDIDEIPEIPVKWGRGKPQTLLVSATGDLENRHIMSFTIPQNSPLRTKFTTLGNDGQYVKIRGTRVVNNKFVQDYRLYEANPLDASQFRELEPLGERRAFVEIAADGRNKSRVPLNKDHGHPDPWNTKEKITPTPPKGEEGSTEIPECSK